jgi:signal transduction histidine kinase
LDELIFEPFMSTKENGTGLGLPVSYGIIEARGGRLKMIPSEGRGACFLFALPIGDSS